MGLIFTLCTIVRESSLGYVYINLFTKLWLLYTLRPLVCPYPLTPPPCYLLYCKVLVKLRALSAKYKWVAEQNW